MEITCPNCGQTCEVDEEPTIGQHLLCPFCDMKFNYTPQNTTENDSYSIANTAEPKMEASPAKIQATCPHCGATYEVDADYIGETATCGTCDKAFIIKAAQETQSPDAPADAAAEKAAENTPAATNGHIAAKSGRIRINTLRTKAKAPANAAKDKLVALRQRGGNSKLKLVIPGIAALLTANLVVAVLFYFNKGAGDELKNLNSDGDGIVQDTRKAIETSSQANQIHSTGKITTESSISTNDAGDGFRDMNSDGDGVAKGTRRAIATPRQTNQIHSTGAITTESSTDSCKATIVLPPGAPGELLLKYAELGETDYVRAVLAQNPTLDVNRPKAAGNKTALYLACEKGFSDIVELLLRKNADTKICDAIPRSLRGGAHEYSPLTIAAKNGHLAILKMLLTAGKVNIESRDGNNRTALYAAAANNHPEAVRFLCQSKAKVNIQGVNKWTPLTAAARQGYADVVKVLLQYGDNPDLEMPGGWPTESPLLHAVKNNHPKVVEILCKAKAKVNIHCPPNNLTPLMESIDMGYTEVVKALLKYGNGLDVEMRGGRLSETALHRAVSQNNPEIVELLCKAGANVHAETGTYLGDLTTPLGRARYKGYSNVVKILERYK